MENDFLERIEEAALNAWPAPRQIVYDGWLLRFAGGESKRINAVNIRYPSKLPLIEKIRHCETLYNSQNQPTIFRIPEPWTSADLIQTLADAGYHAIDPTLVLGRKVVSQDELLTGVEVCQMPVDDWISMRARLTDSPLSKMSLHAANLKLIVPDKVLLGVFVDDQPVSCGMGVVEGDLLGYFSIYTKTSERFRGFGRATMAALTQWGVERGAAYGYLQVEGDNTPALEMYQKLGFELCYPYVYYKR